MYIDQNTQKAVATDLLHGILFGGDQLTRKRIETVKESRKNSTTPVTQLKGLIPICEDCHAKSVFGGRCMYLKSVRPFYTLRHIYNVTLAERNVSVVFLFVL